MLIHVTQQHIDEGQCAPTGCPMALALIEADWHSKPFVGQSGIRYIDDEDELSNAIQQLSAPMQLFLEAFDQGGVVKPFTFELAQQPR